LRIEDRSRLAVTLVRASGEQVARTALNDAAVEAYNERTGTTSDPPARVADALVRLIESEAAERTIGFPERLGVRLNPLLGPLLDGSFAKQRQALDALPLNPPPTPRGSA